MLSLRLLRWAVPLTFVATISAAEHETPLIAAVKASRGADARRLIAEHVDVNAPELDGTTPLHWAAYQGDEELVALLLAAGARVSTTNRYGVSPLAVACASGQAGIVERLLSAGADANATSPDGETALMTASRTGRADVVKLLLAHSANPNAHEGWRRQTALMWAASIGDVAVIDALIEHGAEVSARSGSMVPPREPTDSPALSRSTGTGGRTGGGAGLTPLLFAVRAGRIDATRTLLAAGANVNDRAPDGTSALMIAILNAHFQLAVALLDAGASITTDAAGLTPLHLALQVRNPDWDRFPDPKPTGTLTSLDLVRALLDHGADADAKTTRRVQGITGMTPFILAAKAADIEAMRLLAARGANPTLAANDGTTALMVAAGLTFTEGKTRTRDADAVTAVQLAIELGADVNAANNAGDTALHGAAGRGANEVVKRLVEHGARIEARNAKGLTPLDATEMVAEGKTAHPDTAALLHQLANSR
jgi:ankyrin repeat protein